MTKFPHYDTFVSSKGAFDNLSPRRVCTMLPTFCHCDAINKRQMDVMTPGLYSTTRKKCSYLMNKLFFVKIS